MKPNALVPLRWSQGGRKPAKRADGDIERKKKELQQWTILVDPDKCTGCESCVEACSARRGAKGDHKLSSIRVTRLEDNGPFIPVLCSQCKEAPCVPVCPGAVLSREREYGLITVDEPRCSSCGSCLFSCAFDVLHLGGRRLAAEPCDLCGGAPSCVEACAAGALKFVETNKEVIAAKQEVSQRLSTRDESIP
jgi:anaerobic carbon-monoxide dehydrogenase iron sulfur subunit